MKRLKYIILCALLSFLTTGCTEIPNTGLANPWIECGQDLKCANKKAGFNFPIELSSCNIRAMEDMIEIDYPLNENKNISLRKSKKYNGNGDISGDYNNYSVNKEISINNIKFNVRGENSVDKIHVVNFSSDKAHYAIMSEQNLNLDEIWNIYEIIKKADTIK